MELIQLEYPILVTGGDGTTLWYGCGSNVNVQRGVSTEATATVSPGQALSWDPSGLRMQPWDRSATSTPLKQVAAVKLSTTTGNLDSFAGVALTVAAANIAVPTDGTMLTFAGHGSVVPVKSTAVGTIRFNCAASATAGSITPTSAVPSAPGSHLGRVVKIGGTTGGTTDSGSASYVLCAVGWY